MDFRLCSCGCGGALHEYELAYAGPLLMVVRPLGLVGTEPVSLDLAKSHLRVTQTAEDTLIAQYVSAARRAVEAYCEMSVAIQSWEAMVGDVASSQVPIPLPWGPVRSVTAVESVAPGGSRAPIAGYTVTGPVVAPPPEGWPPAPAAVAITYQAGSDAPEPPLIQSILLLTGQYYDHRAPIHVGSGSVTLPNTWDFLLAPYRQTTGVVAV
jgi:uncharacterized phiE125 gp8 family phage protein